MARRYQRFDIVIRQADGNAARGAPLTIRKLSDGSLATLYKGDSLSGGETSNPINSSETGVIQFFAGDLSENYTFTVPGDLTWESVEGTADTVENHRQVPNHAAGSIQVSEIDFAAPVGDLLTHASLQTNTHGLVPTEHFAHTKAGTAAGATDSPDFAEVTFDTLTPAVGGKFGEYTLVPDSDDLTTAIAAASTAQTLLLVGGDTSHATLTKNSINGFGVDTGAFIAATGASNALTVTSTTQACTVQNLIVDNQTGGDALEVTNSTGVVHLRGLEVTSTATALKVTGTSKYLFIADSEFIGVDALDFAATTAAGPIMVSNCHFVGLTKLTTPTTNLYGGTFTNCTFTGNVTIDSPNMRFYGCVFYGNVTLTSTAAPCLLPTNGNVIIGTLTGGVYAGPFNQWDYITSWIDIDNSGPTKTDEFFLVGTAGIGGVFNHGLGSRQLEIVVQVSNNSNGTDERWTITSQLTVPEFDLVAPRVAGDTQTPVAGHMCAHIIDGNNFNLVMYAGEHQTGSGISTGGKTIFTAVDSQNIVANAEADDYAFASAGGYSFDRVWIRVLARVMFG